jgi:hypothetical protein
MSKIRTTCRQAPKTQNPEHPTPFEQKQKEPDYRLPAPALRLGLEMLLLPLDFS